MPKIRIEYMHNLNTKIGWAPKTQCIILFTLWYKYEYDMNFVKMILTVNLPLVI